MKELTKLLQAKFDQMMNTSDKLFRSSVTGDQIWELYLEGFGDDPIFRDPSSSVHNCNICKNFLRNYGGIVSINDDLTITSIFDIDDSTIPDEYRSSIKMIRDKILSSVISDLFVETGRSLNATNYPRLPKSSGMYQLGIDRNRKIYTEEEAQKYGVVIPGKIYEFSHLYLKIQSKFITRSTESKESIIGRYRSSVTTLKRSLDEISTDSLETVIDLVDQGSLLDGTTHIQKVKDFLSMKLEYDKISSEDKKMNFCWLNGDSPRSRFRNELIGVLCCDLSSGADLESAVRSWNIRVDPSNYMRTTAPITKKQIAEAKKFVSDNGYEESFNRRCATLDDIKSSDILHMNIGSGEISKLSVFDKISPTKSNSSVDESKVQRIGIQKFMTEILPDCTSVEVYLKSSLEKNFVTLTTSCDKASKGIFKWNNNYSWTYNGGLAGKSLIKDAVKSAGGFVDAPFRFSIMWNEDGRDVVDLDAHAYEPNGNHIYYGHFKLPRKTVSGGTLDIDMIRPANVGVENIYWKYLNDLEDGTYRFLIHNYDGGRNKGAKAEIFINGKSYQYEIPSEIRNTVKIADVTIKNGELVDIESYASQTNSGSTSKVIYGLKTNEFHKVTLVCTSPNHWGSNSVGNLHYFFMLDGAKSPESIRSFHNENLSSELIKHKKVMDVLAASTKVESTDGQLSGVGFNSTVRDEVMVRVNGSRLMKIEF